MEDSCTPRLACWSPLQGAKPVAVRAVQALHLLLRPYQPRAELTLLGECVCQGITALGGIAPVACVAQPAAVAAVVR